MGAPDFAGLPHIGETLKRKEDYRFLTPERQEPKVVKKGSLFEVTVSFVLKRPGRYRLRAATVDLAGRSTVTWTNLAVTD